MSLNSVVVKKKRRAARPSGPATGMDPTYLSQVVAKLKKLPEYSTKNPEELRQEAKRLTSTEELRECFSHLTTDVFEQYAGEIAEEREEVLMHSEEVKLAQERAMQRLRPLSVKLFLFELRTPTSRFFSKFSQLFAFKYGALHAAIQIGDVVLQWSTSSLVIPERYDPGDPVFQTDFKNATEAAKVTVDLRSRAQQAVKNMDYTEQIDLQFDLTAGIEEMIEKVKKVIVKYNSRYYYNVLHRNCQTFVDDVMKEIGVKNAPKKLTGKLQEYFKQLTAKKSIKPPDLPTHEALDDYVRGLDFSKLTQHDKEYLLCLYFQFHLEAMKVDKDLYEECRVEGCGMDIVEMALEAEKVAA